MHCCILSPMRILSLVKYYLVSWSAFCLTRGKRIVISWRYNTKAGRIDIAFSTDLDDASEVLIRELVTLLWMLKVDSNMKTRWKRERCRLEKTGG